MLKPIRTYHLGAYRKLLDKHEQVVWGHWRNAYSQDRVIEDPRKYRMMHYIWQQLKNFDGNDRIRIDVNGKYEISHPNGGVFKYGKFNENIVGNMQFLD